MKSPRWFVREDLDGFFGLAINNLVQILVIVSLCQGVLQFSNNLIYGTILPSIALSLIVGNFYYSWLAYQQGKKENRDDFTAIPYGINTISLFAYVFLVMLPVKLDGLGKGMSPESASELAWQAGVVACFGSGIIELLGAFIVDKLKDLTPRAALLSTLSGIALSFISLGFFLRTYAHPLVGIVPFGVILLTYFGEVKFKIPVINLEIPGGLLAIFLGTVLAWLTGLNTWDTNQLSTALEPVSLHLPRFTIGALWQEKEVLISYFSIILPMGLVNVVGSLQNLESAEAAGDKYPSIPCMVVDGVGTIVAAIFGSCFPTTIYIGHPGWKEMGARVGYSWLNAVIMAFLCVSGTVGLLSFLVPIDSGMAIVLWIGIVIVVQSFNSTPKFHAPAVVIGMLPGIAGWGALIAKNALRAAGLGTPDMPFLPDILIPAFEGSDLYITGAFALEQGLIFSAMILSAMTVHIIEKDFGKAGLWALSGCFLSWLGLLHSFKWTIADTVLDLGWGKGGSFALSYLFLALLLFWAQFNSGVGRENLEKK